MTDPNALPAGWRVTALENDDGTEVWADSNGWHCNFDTGPPDIFDLPGIDPTDWRAAIKAAEAKKAELDAKR